MPARDLTNSQSLSGTAERLRPSDDTPPQKQEGLSAKQWAAVLVLLTVGAYIPAFYADFIWDDPDYVLNNFNLRTTKGLVRIWLEPQSSPQYYPLVHTSYWLEYRLWELGPAGYHATNIFLHAASAVILWRILLLLELPGAWVAAAVFALHPVHVESVAWVTERKNTLSLVFYLAAAYCFLQRELVPQSRGSWILYFASLALFLAALLCKTVTATLPCALLVVLWWKQGTLSLRQIALATPMLLIAIPLGLHTAYLERHHVGAVGPDWDYSFVERCLIAGRAVWFYAGKLVVPYPLIFMYPRWEIDAGDWRQYLYPISAVAFVAALLLLVKRIGRGPLAAALFFGGTLFPALGFFNVYPMRYSFVADHFQYAASIGLIVLLVCGASWLLAKYRLASAGPLVACPIVLGLAVLTWRQSLIYGDLESLWRDTLAKNPTCEMAYINLGTWLRDHNRHSEAVELFQTAIEHEPGNPDFQIGLAAARAGLGHLDEAEQILRNAIQLDANHALTYSNLADVLYRKGQPGEAEKMLQRAIALDEKNVLIRNNYGVLLFKERRLAEAQRQYELVLKRVPEFIVSRFNLAVIHMEQGRWTDAAAELRKVLELEPKHQDARDLLDEAVENARANAPPPPPPRPRSSNKPLDGRRLRNVARFVDNWPARNGGRPGHDVRPLRVLVDEPL